jgi:hypothetical protein
MNKIKWLHCGLLSLITVLPITTIGIKSVSAQCVQADVSVQYNISGSRQKTQRINDVQMQAEGSCSGNSIVTTSVQGNEGGTATVVQRRIVRQRLQGNPTKPHDVIINPVQTKTNVGIDVYNPAVKWDK